MGFSDLPPDPPTDLQGPPMPALVSGTSQEFLGEKPLPRVIRDRGMVFILGPAGVGKSTVALTLAGDEALSLTENEVLGALKDQVREREWTKRLLNAHSLLLECPCFLDRRPAALDALRAFLRLRAGGGRRTIVVEAASGTAMERLMEAVHPGYRATIVLRFPVGRGRLRFAKRLCTELQISEMNATETTTLDPWTYAAVKSALTSGQF